MVVTFTGVALGATYPLVTRLGDALPNDLGDPVLNAWILAWDADRFLHGFRGLWNAPIFFPYQDSLAYSEHLLGIAFFTAPLQWLTDNPIIVYNAAFLGSFVLAGAGMYLLATSLTGSRVGGIIGGVAFAFLPYRAEHISHLQILMYGWMPVALWAFHRYFATGQRMALAGFAVAFLLQGLSNGHFFYFLAVAVIVIGAIELICWVRVRPVMVVDLAVTALVMFVSLVPVLAAYLDARAAHALYRTPDEILRFSADAASYLSASNRLTVWGEVLPQGKPEGSLFPGFGLLILAGFGLVAAVVRFGNGADVTRFRRYGAAYGLVAFVGFMFSLGPELSVAGTTVTGDGPYNWLLGSIPGLDSLRVPARFSIIVFLALTVLAAVGARRLFDVLPMRVAAVLCVVFSASFIVEGYHPIEMKDFSNEPANSERAAYEWLATSPDGGTVVLPLEPQFPTIGTLRYVYDTVHHGHPIVNGYSGYTPAVFRELLASGASLDFQAYGDFLQGLRALDVRYIVVSLDRFRDLETRDNTLASVRAHPDQLANEHDFGASLVFELHPWGQSRDGPPEIRPPVAPTTFQAFASHGQERLGLVFDGDYDTRWLTNVPQEGTEWLELHFTEQADVAHVRLWMHQRSFGDYPRQLLVESTTDGVTYAELYQGRGFPRLLLGMVSNSTYVPIDIALPPNGSRTLRLRQTSASRTFYWSIHELELWTR